MNHLEYSSCQTKVRHCLEQGQSLKNDEEIVRQAPQVRQLNLQHIRISPAMMQEIVTLFPQLTSLKLDFCKLDDDSVRLISKLSLVELDVSNNPELVGSFVSHLPITLEKLAIGGNKQLPIQTINAIWARFRGKNFTLTH